MATSKANIILVLMMGVLFVQESIEDYSQEVSGRFANALSSSVLLQK